MGKQIKKIRPAKPPKHYKECERCGNGGVIRKEMFTCKYCGYPNGFPEGVVFTRGGLEDDR